MLLDTEFIKKQALLSNSDMKEEIKIDLNYGIE